MRVTIIPAFLSVVAAHDNGRTFAAELVAERQVTTAPTPVTIRSDICGWRGGAAASPHICAISGYSCMVEPRGKYIGCCPPTAKSCGAFRTACVAQTDPCDSACLKNDQTRKCSGDRPICATYAYPNQVLDYRCENTIGQEFDVQYTYTGFSAPILLPREIADYTALTSGDFPYGSVNTGTQFPVSSRASPSSTPSSPVAASTSTWSSTMVATIPSNAPPSAYLPTATTSSTSSADSSSPSPVPIGAIVGGAVGGLATIAALVGLLLWPRFKRRTAERAKANSRNMDHHGVGSAGMYELTGDAKNKDVAEVSSPSVTRHELATVNYVEPTELPGHSRLPSRTEPKYHFDTTLT